MNSCAISLSAGFVPVAHYFIGASGAPTGTSIFHSLMNMTHAVSINSVFICKYGFYLHINHRCPIARYRLSQGAAHNWSGLSHRYGEKIIPDLC
jgi:hypothetical protein